MPLHIIYSEHVIRVDKSLHNAMVETSYLISSAGVPKQ